jgi:hypothetical protein
MKYTREQLAGMSDYDINEALAIKLGYIINNTQYLGYADRDENIVLLYEGVGFDLNGWNTIMPLAIKYNIALSPADNRPEGGQWYADRIFSDELESCWCDKKPQRAIACVLLLMEGL